MPILFVAAVNGGTFYGTSAMIYTYHLRKTLWHRLEKARKELCWCSWRSLVNIRRQMLMKALDSVNERNNECELSSTIRLIIA